MDKKTFDKLEGAEILTWLVSQDDVKAQSDMLMYLLGDIGKRFLNGTSSVDISTLKQAFRRVVFEAAVKHYGDKLAVDLLESSTVHAVAYLSHDLENHLDVVIK